MIQCQLNVWGTANSTNICCCASMCVFGKIGRHHLIVEAVVFLCQEVNVSSGTHYYSIPDKDLQPSTDYLVNVRSVSTFSSESSEDMRFNTCKF